MMLTARPTTYRGIPMRSRLEASFAADLDATDGLEWVYEPRAFANERGQYLPDFEVTAFNGPMKYPVFIEVRPTIERAYLAMDRMPIIWDSEPSAGLLITVPGSVYFIAYPDDRTWRVRT